MMLAVVSQRSFRSALDVNVDGVASCQSHGVTESPDQCGEGPAAGLSMTCSG